MAGISLANLDVGGIIYRDRNFKQKISARLLQAKNLLTQIRRQKLRLNLKNWKGKRENHRP